MRGVTVNVAREKPAVQSKTFQSKVASMAVDGDLATASCAEQRELSAEPWLSIDLREAMDVGRVCVINDANQIYG